MNSFNECKKLVGNTPLVNYKKNIYAKFECYNPTGSIKDRIVFYIFEDAIKNNIIDISNTQVIEASSGNTGISVAFVSSLLNLKCKIIMPCDMSDERKKYIKMFGSELIEVNEGDFTHAINLRNNLAIKNNWFNVNQFHNQLNIDCHYNTTGQEILDQLHPKIPDILISGSGTGGTIMGVSKKLKEINPKLKVIIIEPDESPVMSGGKPGLHKIQGIGDGSKFLVDLNIVDRIIRIKSDDAIEKMKNLHKSGYFIGISAAANLIASEIINKEYPDKIIVTFMCDRGDRYMSMT